MVISIYYDSGERTLRSDRSEIDIINLNRQIWQWRKFEVFEDYDNLVDNLFSDNTDYDQTYEPQFDPDLQSRPTVLDDSDYKMDITSNMPGPSTTATNSRPKINIPRIGLGQQRRVISSDEENEDSE